MISKYISNFVLFKNFVRFIEQNILMQEKESKTNWHFWTSLIKSVVRIVACWRLYEGDLHEAAGYFILAESLGIVEEIL